MLKNYKLKEIEERKSIGGCFDTRIYEVVDFDNDYEALEKDIKEYNENCSFWLSMMKGNIINGKQTVELIIDHLD